MEMKFIKDLVGSIVKNKDMPKVQVEREISPILEMFIEGFMDELGKNGKVAEGSYKFIAPEFPLSNEDDSHRSVNIDYLLLNKDTNTLYFIELKTDSSSFKLEQYHYYLDVIANKSTIELYDFLGSLKNTKYKNYKKEIDQNITEEEFKNIRKIELIYLAPKKLTLPNKRRNEKGQKAIEEINFITFEDLDKFNNINSEYSMIWKEITPILVDLDDN